MVLGKVGGAGFAAMASISWRWVAMVVSKASGKWSGWMMSKGGMPKGVVQAVRRGFGALMGASRAGWGAGSRVGVSAIGFGAASLGHVGVGGEG